MKIADLKLTSVQSRIGRGMAVGLMLMCSAQLGSLDAAISFPGETWTESTPEAESMDAATLGELAETLGGRGLIIRNGRIVKSWGTYQRRGDWFGASYPLANTVLFFALDEGRIKSVHEKVETRGWALDSVDRGINFHQLANLTSGYSRPEPPGAAWSYDSLGMRLYQMTLFDRVYNAPPISVLLQGDRLGPYSLRIGR